MNRRGEAILGILAAIAGLAIVIGAALKYRGNLYPEKYYPYQGPITIETNAVVEPRW